MKKAHVILALLASLIALPAFCQSPWLAPPGQWTINPSYTFQSFRDFWMGPDKATLPAELERISQHTFRVHLDYGLSENLAVDLRTGYTRSSTDTGLHDDGVDDTAFGLRWKILDEFSAGTATLTLRVGGIVHGSYDTGFPFAAGDGASGVEASLLMGKLVGDGAGVSGEFGYRTRAENVPEDFFFSMGAYRNLSSNMIASVGYRRCQALSGRDISDPDFQGRWTELKEVVNNLELAVGYNDTKGRYAGAFISRTIDGRNTGKQTVIGFSASFSW